MAKIIDNSRQAMIDDLKKTLDKACDAYYNSDTVLMSDEEFDNACITYQKMSGKKYDTRTAPRRKDSKTNKRIIDTEHTFENLLCTIDNKFQSLDELFDWMDTAWKNLGIKSNQEIDILVSEKYDGNSICIEYEGGKSKVAVTRGEDGKGADLTHIFKNETLLKKPKLYCGIKYEVMLSYANFNKLNELREEAGEDPYVNPRNTVAGLLGRLDSAKFRKYLTLVPLSIQIKDKEISREKELELIDLLQKKGDIDYNGELISGNLETIKEEISRMYDEYIPKREKMKYMIDGLVIEFMDNKLKKKLGNFASGSPKWQAAVKFPYMEKTTIVEDIVFEASPNGTGKITPSVIYKPVYFNGAEMHKTSIANYKRFNELKLGKGSKIIVSYRNDVLCYVTKLNVPENDKIEPIKFTDTCPACHSTRIRVNDKKTFAYCDNPKCYMKTVGKINNYTNQVGIKGIDTNTLVKIYSADLIHDASDLYHLKFKDLARIEGLGDKSAENIIDAIKSTTPNDYDILAGLGIDNLGKDAAKNILTEFSFDNLCDLKFIKSDEFKDRLGKIDGIGPIMTKRIPIELENNNGLLNELLAVVKFKAVKRAKATNQLVFVTTGDPNKKYFASRDELRQFIEMKGHKLTSAVSKNTDYLVTETPNSGTVKNKKAQELGKKIITCEELIDLLEGNKD